MSNNSRSIRVTKEVYDFWNDLSLQVSEDLGIEPNKTMTLNMFANDFKGRVKFRNKKWDFKIF